MKRSQKHGNRREEKRRAKAKKATRRNYVGQLRHVSCCATIRALGVQGRTLFTGDDEGVLTRWEMLPGKGSKEEEQGKGGRGEAIFALALGRDAVYCGRHDGSLSCLDLELLSPRFTVRAHRGRCLSLSVHSTKDCDIVCSGGQDGAVRVWHSTSNESAEAPSEAFKMTKMVEANAHGASVNALVLAPRADGWGLFSGSGVRFWDRGGDDNSIVAWHLFPSGDGQLLLQHQARMVGHEDCVRALVLSPPSSQDAWLFSASYDGAIIVWDTATSAAVLKLLPSHSWLHSLAISNTGTLCVGAEDGALMCFPQLESHIRAVVEAPRAASTAVAAAGMPDPVTELSCLTFTSTTGFVVALAIAPCGTTLWSSDGHGSVREWGLPLPTIWDRQRHADFSWEVKSAVVRRPTLDPCICLCGYR